MHIVYSRVVERVHSSAVGARLNGVRQWGCACSAVFLSSALATWVHATDETYSQDAVKAAYLYRFADYIEWPEESAAKHSFTVAVYDAHGVAQELRRLLPEHPVHGEIAQVREVTSVQELGDPQILYVGTARPEFLRALAANGDRPILVVTADERGLELGSVLNFVFVDKRVRFEVSLTAAERVGLKISSELLSVAIRVRGGRRQSDDLCIPFSLPEDGDAACGLRQARCFLLRERGDSLLPPRRSTGNSWNSSMRARIMRNRNYLRAQKRRA